MNPKSPAAKVGLFCLVLLLSACRRTDNPDDVAIEFWTALIENDLKKAAQYSTESSAQAFNENLRNASLQIGHVKYICNGATVETHIQLQSAAASSSFKTVLIRDEEKDAWKVDYPLTLESMNKARDKRFKNIVETGKEAGKNAQTHLWPFMKGLGHAIVAAFKTLKDRLFR